MPILVEFHSLSENIDLCKKLDLDFIELNLDIPYCFIDRLDTNSLKNNNFTIHLSEKFDVGELNNSLRNFYLNEIEKIISFGIKYNIFKYNLHLDPGIHFSLPNKKIFIYEEYIDDYLKAYEDYCNICLTHSYLNNDIICTAGGIPDITFDTETKTKKNLWNIATKLNIYIYMILMVQKTIKNCLLEY